MPIPGADHDQNASNQSSNKAAGSVSKVLPNDKKNGNHDDKLSPDTNANYSASEEPKPMKQRRSSPCINQDLQVNLDSPAWSQGDISTEEEDGQRLLPFDRSQVARYSFNYKQGDKKARKESFKAMKMSYKMIKKKVHEESYSSLTDPSAVITQSWLKIRGSLKTWAKYWCVLKPAVLLIYKHSKHEQWVGTVLLSTCDVIERPSKKEGFCFKVYHPLDESIWATRGPKGEYAGSIAQPMPRDHLIIRAPTEEIGRCWLDFIEVAVKARNPPVLVDIKDDTTEFKDDMQSGGQKEDFSMKHLAMDTLTERRTDFGLSDLDADDRSGVIDASDFDATSVNDEDIFVSTTYIPGPSDDTGDSGEMTESIEDENKNLLWAILKQVRPGMDLSRVVLPTFILEPRSLLQKFADYYFHADILSQATKEESAIDRMKGVVRWYLSGFYKKPKGLKKPYNPLLGEMYRCQWKHLETDSVTFYVAEQVSHHPPISAFYVSNRKDGFCINASILTRSKFYGNSTQAILDGSATLVLLDRGEEYVITMPYANCKGILLGTMTMELGGDVSITCLKTGYTAEITFKLKSFWAKKDATNLISGKIKLGKDVLYTLSGHWDGDIYIVEKKSENRTLFWSPTPEMKKKRLPISVVDLESQRNMESEKLWRKVTEAITKCDQEAATIEKSKLEDMQRNETKERKLKGMEWKSKFFSCVDPTTNQYVYRYTDIRPWDPNNDLLQYEYDGRILTKTRHRNIRRNASPLPSGEARKLIRASSLMKKSIESSSDESTNSRTSRSDDDDEDISIRNRPTRKEFKHLQDTVLSMRTKQDQCLQQMGTLHIMLQRLNDQLNKKKTKSIFSLPLVFVVLLSICIGIIISHSIEQ